MNTKVPLCCASNAEVNTTDNLVFVNRTTLRVVGGHDVTVRIYRNTGGIAMHDRMMVDGLIQAQCHNIISILYYSITVDLIDHQFQVLVIY